MRRKSERTATKKAKVSPDKKEKEKVKRKSTRRRKQSSSSENDSVEEAPPVQKSETSEVKTDPPATLVKEDSPEESQDQVWQVKAAGSSGDVGEIQKLKICLTRPPSTPERVDRSPRSKRKHSRATSSSDTPSTEGDDKKKSRHRSKRTAETKEESEKNQDSHDEPEIEVQTKVSNKLITGVAANEESENKEANKESEIKEESVVTEQTQVSTTNYDNKDEKTSSITEENQNKESDNQVTEEEKSSTTEVHEKTSDADTTVASPKNESVCETQNEVSELISPNTESFSGDQSEVLELQAEESRCESSDFNLNESQDAATKQTNVSESAEVTNVISSKVSISEYKTDVSGMSESNQKKENSTNLTDVVESSQSIVSENEEHVAEDVNKEESTKLVQESNDNKIDVPNPIKEVQNGETTPSVINRKRRWGSRPSKLSTQKSITISTDVLKEIIPDVKPVEFEEVVEEKKHKRVEVPEKVERPVLPKIIIDNTDNVKKDQWSEDKDKENVKNKDVHLSATRKISIVKENDSIITRPPSPPRHKQSNILYITNLVRPFTLLQLKNLLQRTGKILDDGFWIDRIKSKCYVKYEKEDQAVETRHALHGVRWPVSNPKTLHVDFSTVEDFDKAKHSESSDSAPVSTIPGTVEDWLREQDMKRERELEKPWERKASTREWDVGKNEKDKEPGRHQMDKYPKDERLHDKRRHRTPERSPEPARKFKKKEEEAPAKLLDDLFRKTKTTPCIYWLPLSAETIAVKEEQRRQHMAEHERRMQELRRTHRRH